MEAPLGTALGIAAGPCRGVHREHQGPILRTAVDQQFPQSAVVNITLGQGRVEAAVAAAELRFETE